MSNTSIGIFTHLGLYAIVPGKEEKFFNDSEIEREGIIRNNALGILSWEALQELKDELSSYPSIPDCICMLERGIEAADGNVEEAVEKATAEFREMRLEDIAYLILIWINKGINTNKFNSDLSKKRCFFILQNITSTHFK